MNLFSCTLPAYLLVILQILGMYLLSGFRAICGPADQEPFQTCFQESFSNLLMPYYLHNLMWQQVPEAYYYLCKEALNSL